MQDLVIGNIDQVVLYDRFWGAFAIMRISNGFTLSIQIKNNLPDVIFVYKLEKQPCVVFGFEISRDHGAIEPQERHTIEIQYKPKFDLNSITDRHSFLLTIVKMRTTEIYRLKTVNISSEDLMREHDGNQYNITFLPRSTPSISQLTLHDFDFIQKQKTQKDESLRTPISPQALLQNTYTCLQTRLRYFQQQKVKKEYLDTLTSQALYLKVGINYFSQLSLTDRIRMVKRIRHQLKTSEFCYVCKTHNDNFKQQLHCGICGCFIGCCQECAVSFLKLHFFECNKFVGYKLLQNLTQEEMEQCFMEYKEENTTINRLRGTHINGNQYFKEQWISECQKMLDDAEKYVDEFDKEPDKCAPDINARVRVVPSSQILDETRQILQIFNHNKERQDYEIEVEIDQDVKNMMENITKCSNRSAYINALDRCKQIYNGYYNNMVQLGAQYHNSLEFYKTERQKIEGRTEQMRTANITALAQIPNLADDSQRNSSKIDPVREFTDELDNLIDGEYYEPFDRKITQIFLNATDEEHRVREITARVQECDRRSDELRAQINQQTILYKESAQKLQEVYQQNQIYTRILDIIGGGICDQKGYERVKESDDYSHLEQLMSEHERYTERQSTNNSARWASKPQEHGGMGNSAEVQHTDTACQQTGDLLNGVDLQVDDSLAEEAPPCDVPAEVPLSGQQSRSLMQECSDQHTDEQQHENKARPYNVTKIQLLEQDALQQNPTQQEELAHLSSCSQVSDDDESVSTSERRPRLYNTMRSQTQTAVAVDDISAVPDESVRVQLEQNSLYQVSMRLQKFQMRFSQLGGEMSKAQYFRLVDLQANMHNIIQDQLTKILFGQLQFYNMLEDNVNKFDPQSSKSVESRFRPQTNINLPHPFRLFLMQYLEVAFEYEQLQDAMERMSYYCIAREPWLLEEYEISADPAASVDADCPDDVLYEMLRVVGSKGIESP